MAGNSEYYKQLDDVARKWVNGLRQYASKYAKYQDPISTNTGATEVAIRKFIRSKGFTNASSMSRTTMLFLLCMGIEGDIKSYFNLDDIVDASTDQLAAGLPDAAANVGVTQKEMLDWFIKVVF